MAWINNAIGKNIIVLHAESYHLHVSYKISHVEEDTEARRHSWQRRIQKIFVGGWNVVDFHKLFIAECTLRGITIHIIAWLWYNNYVIDNEWIRGEYGKYKPKAEGLRFIFDMFTDNPFITCYNIWYLLPNH